MKSAGEVVSYRSQCRGVHDNPLSEVWKREERNHVVVIELFVRAQSSSLLLRVLVNLLE